MSDFDLFVIGAGSGGVRAARVRGLLRDPGADVGDHHGQQQPPGHHDVRRRAPDPAGRQHSQRELHPSTQEEVGQHELRERCAAVFGRESFEAELTPPLAAVRNTRTSRSATAAASVSEATWSTTTSCTAGSRATAIVAALAIGNCVM